MAPGTVMCRITQLEWGGVTDGVQSEGTAAPCNRLDNLTHGCGGMLSTEVCG